MDGFEVAGFLVITDTGCLDEVGRRRSEDKDVSIAERVVGLCIVGYDVVGLFAAQRGSGRKGAQSGKQCFVVTLPGVDFAVSHGARQSRVRLRGRMADI